MQFKSPVAIYLHFTIIGAAYLGKLCILTESYVRMLMVLDPYKILHTTLKVVTAIVHVTFRGTLTSTLGDGTAILM